MRRRGHANIYVRASGCASKRLGLTVEYPPALFLRQRHPQRPLSSLELHCVCFEYTILFLFTASYFSSLRLLWIYYPISPSPGSRFEYLRLHTNDMRPVARFTLPRHIGFSLWFRQEPLHRCLLVTTCRDISKNKTHRHTAILVKIEHKQRHGHAQQCLNPKPKTLNPKTEHKISRGMETRRSEDASECIYKLQDPIDVRHSEI